MSKKELMAVGVIVARFQVSELHRGHLWLVKEVLERHRSVLIVLGVRPGEGNDLDPLTYEMRKRMVEQTFPNEPRIKILPIADHPFSHEIWSQKLDILIDVEFPGRAAVLYGARDSIADPNKEKKYTGKHPVICLDSPFKMSGTEVRATTLFPHTKDARAALIWHHQTRYPHVYSTSDVAIWNPRTRKVLLTKKKIHEGKAAFMGGFVEKTDANADFAGRRERSEEIIGIEIGPLKQIGTDMINDPRYRGTKDGILTNFFVAEYLGGEPEAGDDVDEVCWTFAEYLQFEGELVPWHQNLGKMFVDYLNQQNRAAA